MKEKYKVDKEGNIVTKGGILYEACAIAHLSPSGKKRLAELHTENNSLVWENCDVEAPDSEREDALNILIREGYLPDERKAAIDTVANDPEIQEAMAQLG